MGEGNEALFEQKSKNQSSPWASRTSDQTGKVLEHTAPIVLKSLPLPL